MHCIEIPCLLTLRHTNISNVRLYCNEILELLSRLLQLNLTSRHLTFTPSDTLSYHRMIWLIIDRYLDHIRASVVITQSPRQWETSLPYV